MIFESYFEKNIEVLEKIKSTQKEKILQAAKIAARSIMDDGIIYIFG